MITLEIFIIGLIVFSLVIATISAIGWILLDMISTMGKPECRKCEEYDNDIEYCWYTHDCHDCHQNCNNFKRKKL